MKTKTLNIPNTTENHEQVTHAVAEHMVENCLTQQQIEDLAIAHLEAQFTSSKRSIGDLAQLVKDTPPNDEGCYVPQLPYALYSGTSVNDFSGDINHYFFTREESIQYSALEVKETITITTKEVQ